MGWRQLEDGWRLYLGNRRLRSGVETCLLGSWQSRPGLEWRFARRRQSLHLFACSARCRYEQLPYLPSDAYSTGEVLFAMNEAGNLPTGSATYKRGLSFLLNTQAADGSWHVKSRIYHPYPVSPPYFETGFPYGHDQFISAAATSWAIMAISRSLPKRSLPPYTNAGNRFLPKCESNPSQRDPYRLTRMPGRTRKQDRGVDSMP
jgi:hypothetical protein